MCGEIIRTEGRQQGRKLANENILCNTGHMANNNSGGDNGCQPSLVREIQATLNYGS